VIEGVEQHGMEHFEIDGAVQGQGLERISRSGQAGRTIRRIVRTGRVHLQILIYSSRSK